MCSTPPILHPRANKNFSSPVVKRRSEHTIPTAAPHAPPVVHTHYGHRILFFYRSKYVIECN